MAQIMVCFGLGVVSWILEHMLSSAGKSREAQMVGIMATVSCCMLVVEAIKNALGVTRSFMVW